MLDIEAGDVVALGKHKLICGDCLQVLKKLKANSIDAVCTDPPYGLSPDGKSRTWDDVDEGRTRGGFMGKNWDSAVPGVTLWREVMRVLKPGGYLLAFGGTRTSHRMVCAIEDAGFEIRDSIASDGWSFSSLDWYYGSGFPKSANVSKMIDKVAGAEREIVGQRDYTSPKMEAGRGVSGLKWTGSFSGEYAGERVSVPITAPATDAAKQWEGWGTALKPSHEPIVVARKPLSESTVAANVLKWGTGAINVDGCRVGWPDGKAPKIGTPGWGGPNKKLSVVPDQHGATVERIPPADGGRWPPNTVLMHHPDCTETECVDGCPVKVLDEQSGVTKSPSKPVKQGGHHRHDVGLAGDSREGYGVGYADAGGSSRFFPQFHYEEEDFAPFLYCAKASKRERNAGCEKLSLKAVDRYGECGQGATPQQTPCTTRFEGNNHPTVKAGTLMRWLCRLVTPTGGTVLDPFAGSGTTILAAEQEGFKCVGIEREIDYCQIAMQRYCGHNSIEPKCMRKGLV